MLSEIPKYIEIMSSFGHVLDMIKRQSLNREQQKRNRRRFAQQKEYHSLKTDQKQFNSDKFALKDHFKLDQNRERIHRKIKKEHQVALVKTILALLILTLLVFLIFKLL